MFFEVPNRLMRSPDFRLLLSHPAHFISLGFGSGLAPKAPGTAGSLLAWPLFALMQYALPAQALPFIIAAAFVLGCVCAAYTGRVLGVVDHGSIVWDEFVAVWLVLWLVPANIVWQGIAVAVFRFFDIVKPWPIRVADARLKNGFGVMFDDIVAALYSLLVLQLALKLTA